MEPTRRGLLGLFGALLFPRARRKPIPLPAPETPHTYNLTQRFEDQDPDRIFVRFRADLERFNASRVDEVT